jgi:hypothetical protein
MPNTITEEEKGSSHRSVVTSLNSMKCPQIPIALVSSIPWNQKQFQYTGYYDKGKFFFTVLQQQEHS